MGVMPFAKVLAGKRGRIYAPASSEDEPDVEVPEVPHLEGDLPGNTRWFSPPLYGLKTYVDLFTPRQLVALTTFSDLVGEARELALQHARDAGLPDDGIGIADGGTGAPAYADAVATYLTMAVSRTANMHSSQCVWSPAVKNELVVQVFARQALPMIWDYAEGNPFSASTGNWADHLDWIGKVLLSVPGEGLAQIRQLDAAAAVDGAKEPLICTDPPYYDNIGYADLSDFFYVWLRRTLGRTYTSLFSTVLTPKVQELIASPHRHGGDKMAAKRHFEEGLDRAFELIREKADQDYPLSLYYAFKQAEERDSSPGLGSLASTGWETMLRGLGERFQITGTWPLRTERAGRMISIGTNALASSVVLVCRSRPDEAPIATLPEFRAALREHLPRHLNKLIGGHIAPLDLRQAAIGPGMAVFSSRSRVVEPNGRPMSVRRALELINTAYDEYVNKRSFDPDTEFCATWFEQHGLEAGKYGDAETLARSLNISVDALARDGVLESAGGKVRLHGLSHYTELVFTYNPGTDLRVSAWEACHYLTAALKRSDGGVKAAASLAWRLGEKASEGVQIGYRIFAVCERNGWTEVGMPYNALAGAWPVVQAAISKGEQLSGNLSA
jgi:putative DNA methylase